MRSPRHWLYLDAYTLPAPNGEVPSSDAIGYGLTSSRAIRRELARRGVRVSAPDASTPSPEGGGRQHRASWISEAYGRTTEHILREQPDVVFIFHIFVTFPAVIRKTLQDLGVSIPIIGYTHGSHWDPTDVFRSELHPGLEMLDLANMCAVDRLFLVSEYMRETLRRNIGGQFPEAAESIRDKAAVTGLPIDVHQINSARTEDRFDRTTIVFNHAPGTGKNPAVFARVATAIMQEYDVNVLFTRRFRAGSPGEPEIHALKSRFGDRVILGNDLSVADYYRALWMSDIQVSTASHESLGIATLESMYTRNCCVLPMVGSYPEICGERKEILYEPGEDGLVDRLVHFLENPGERREIAEDLHDMTLRYHPEPVVDRILDSVART